MWPPTGDEAVSRLLARLSASAAVAPMTIRAAPESMKPVLTPTLSMMVVAMTGAIRDGAGDAGRLLPVCCTG